MGHNGFGMFGFWYWIIILFIVVGLLPIIKRNFTQTEKNEDSALEILKKRLAKGEITPDEFEELKGKL